MYSFNYRFIYCSSLSTTLLERYILCLLKHTPHIPEMPLSVCGYKKFQLDTLCDHVNTCTTHSGVKKTHDWTVDQLPHLFRPTHKVKTQQVGRNRGQRCGDIEVTTYLTITEGPVSLVMDLCFTHDRWGSISNPSLNEKLHYPTDLDRTLNEVMTDKNLQYRVDHNNRPPKTILVMISTAGHLHCEFVCLLFLNWPIFCNFRSSSCIIQPPVLFLVVGTDVSSSGGVDLAYDTWRQNWRELFFSNFFYGGSPFFSEDRKTKSVRERNEKRVCEIELTGTHLKLVYYNGKPVLLCIHHDTRHYSPGCEDRSRTHWFIYICAEVIHTDIHTCIYIYT